MSGPLPSHVWSHVRFVKAEANGNDFLIVDAAAVAPPERHEFARRICRRHRGIGADGVEFVSPRGSGFDLQLYNADGSEAEISGNGSRCVAAFYARHGFRQGDLFTGAGPRRATVLDGAGQFWVVNIELGIPLLEPTLPLEVLGQTLPAHVLSMGNPQCVVRVEAFPANWRELGAALECHPHFPAHTNVEFVRVLTRSRIEIRIFERGVGPTHSSGTGSSASAVAMIAAGLADSPVEVVAEGGKQTVIWGGGKSPVQLIGPASIVAEGVFLIP
ncbi:MAG: diaminopimelate epimerase [Terriglobales bacterium]